MEEKFIQAWQECRNRAADAGIRLRPLPVEEAMSAAHRCLSGKRVSDGFGMLEKAGHLEWSLEALAVDRRFTALFTDAEANEALERLISAGFF